MIVSRIAPTPSGFLHVGNAVNFAVTAALVDAMHGQLHLRIDDVDTTRARPEYVEDIFWMLDWLNVGPTHGPSSPDEFARSWSQSFRIDTYRAELSRPALRANTYLCACSRRTLRAAVESGTHKCRQRAADRTQEHRAPEPAGPPGSQAPPGREVTPVRARLPEGVQIPTDSGPVDLTVELGDFVLWRREDLPAYQLVSVVEDRDAGVNLIVRGEDLRPSTAAQLWLAPMLDAVAFTDAAFLHHPLLTDASGQKLSKSHRAAGRLGDLSGVELRERRTLIDRTVDQILTGPAVASLDIPDKNHP